jgi:hypothetical protein
VNVLITFKEMESGWQRQETAVMEPTIASELKFSPYHTKE